MSDIIGIVDDNGSLVASYTYDPWGKVTSVIGSNIELGNLNPFRYRSYYYDSDIEMYYLQSRYYDPETGRFLNADDVDYIGLTGTVGSYNAFAYCENHPLNFSDPFGCAISYKVLQGVLGGILGGITQYISDLINVRLFYKEWSKVTKYVSAVVNGVWDAVTNSGFFKKLLVAVGSNVVGQIINKIRYKVDFSCHKIFKTVIDFTFDYVVGEMLNIKAPKTIKEIKSKARELGIKGTKKLTAYLNSVIFETNLTNITLSNVRSWIKLLSQGAFKKLFGSKAKYVA